MIFWPFPSSLLVLSFVTVSAVSLPSPCCFEVDECDSVCVCVCVRVCVYVIVGVYCVLICKKILTSGVDCVQIF